MIQKGRPVPPSVSSALREPDLDEDLIPVLQAWFQLMDGRAVQDGEGLTWAEASRWCEDHEITGWWRLRWCRMLKALDRVYVAHINKAGRGNSRA